MQNLLDANVTGIPSCETLLFGLMTHTRRKTLMDVAMLECTIRVLGTSRILGLAEQVRLADTLCDFLGTSAEGDEIGEERWWSGERLRQLLDERLWSEVR